MSRIRRALLAVLALALFALGWDLGRPPSEQWAARGLIGVVRAYQGTLSGWMPRVGVRCRFEPTCSHYAVGALERYGALGGGVRAAWRIARCAPWTPAGTVDYP